MSAIWVAFIAGMTLVVGLLVLTARRLGQERARRGRVDARLTAVLEGTSAGLSVWNRDRRLVGCNERFREHYPGAPVKPGVVFEDLIRYTANRGLVRLPNDRDETIDAWVAERGARFGQSHHEVWRTADGRWLDVHTRTTDLDEMLMLYADTTSVRETETTLGTTSEQRDRGVADLGMLSDVIRATRAAHSTDDAVARAVEILCQGADFVAGHGYRTSLDGESLAPLTCWYSAPGSAPTPVAMPTVKRDAGPEAEAVVHGEAEGVADREAGAVIDRDAEPVSESAGPEPYGPLRALVLDQHPHRGDGVAGRALASRKLVWIPNVAVDPTIDDGHRAVMEDIHGVCAVPVYEGAADDRVVGVVVLYASRQLLPDTALGQVLESVAATLSWVFTTQSAR